MAMLAEKRQKVRWVLNPRQTAWSKDSNKFGQQYMEKLGWKAGQGIGANLQGCTEHVKVSVRSDNRGVGFKDIPEDVLPHQNNYSDLLAQLATNNPPVKTKADEGKSLELKSRQSRARVHYHKFTRSKDLSTYSQNDLACILGKSSKPTKSPVGESVQDEPNFIHRGNMNAYFKEKRKNTNVNAAEDDKFEEKEEDSLYVGFGFSQVIKDVPTLCSMSENSDKEESDESVKTLKKKHRRNDRTLDKPDSDFSIGDCTDTVQPIENEQKLNESGKSSHRKRKKNAQDVEFPENYFAQTDFRETMYPIDLEGELNENIKKSKKTKHKKVDQSEVVLESERCLPLTDNSDIVQPIEIGEELDETSKKSKKKQKRNYQSVEVPESGSCLNEEELDIKIKKSKKKRKKNDERVEVPEVESCLIQRLCTETQPMETEKESSVNVKTSKKKRKNDQFMEVSGSESCCPQTDFSETIGLQPMEKEQESHISRSKKKRKENPLLSSNRNDLENITINDDTLQNMSSNHQPIHKKKKKKVKGNETIIELQNNDNDFMQTRQKPIKSVRFSDPLLSVLLIPSRDQLQSKRICFDNCEPENCDISLDLNLKKCNQTTNSPVKQDQPSNLSKVASKVVVNGITYTNGISEYNHKLPRKQKYAYDAAKHIFYNMREGAYFDKFPGSNVETLGYGLMGNYVNSTEFQVGPNPSRPTGGS